MLCVGLQVLCLPCPYLILLLLNLRHKLGRFQRTEGLRDLVLLHEHGHALRLVAGRRSAHCVCMDVRLEEAVREGRMNIVVIRGKGAGELVLGRIKHLLKGGPPSINVQCDVKNEGQFLLGILAFHLGEELHKEVECLAN